MKKIYNKNVALVTGASEGIGFEIAKTLSLNGLKVLMVSRDFKKLKSDASISKFYKN